jgi:molybdopterin-guanine dinucleotide biosynthesis adapter protein
MKRLHIIGRKNHGKTRLVTDLIAGLSARGRRIATIKHTHHSHELDTPGKDSFLHREAGAAMVGVLARNMTAVFLPADAAVSTDERYGLLGPLFSGCDLVLVEGHLATSAPRIEVWRADRGTAPLAETDPGIRAIVTDDPVPVPAGVDVFPRSNLAPLLDWVEAFSRKSSGG